MGKTIGQVGLISEFLLQGDRTAGTTGFRLAMSCWSPLLGPVAATSGSAKGQDL